MQDDFRQILKENAGYSSVLSELYSLMESESPIIIAIDGRCGSGKTYFAELIGKLFSCNICHMDDFYLPFEKRQESWKETPGANMDLERFYTEVLKPVRIGRPVIYRPYNCKKGTMEEGIFLPIRKLTVVEGSYSHHPLLAEEYDLKVFLTCSGEEQRKRLQLREGSRFPSFEEQWIPLEEKYLQRYEIEKKSQFVVDTSDFFHVGDKVTNKKTRILRDDQMSLP